MSKKIPILVVSVMSQVQHIPTHFIAIQSGTIFTQIRNRF